jgi:hypothetical protein
MGWLDKQRDKQSAKALEKFEAQLGSGEQILDVQLGVNTDRNGDTFLGELCLTDRRLMFIGKHLTSTMVDEHPLDSTTGLTVTTGKIVGSLAVKHGLKSESYSCNGKALAEFVEKVKAQIALVGEAPVSAGSSGRSSTDELKKLADLHSQGILNDDEFTAAKQRIIDSM